MLYSCNLCSLTVQRIMLGFLIYQRYRTPMSNLFNNIEMYCNWVNNTRLWFDKLVVDCMEIKFLCRNLLCYSFTLTQYNTIPYHTIQYNTIQYNTIQYNTIQYNYLRKSCIHHYKMRVVPFLQGLPLRQFTITLLKVQSAICCVYSFYVIETLIIKF